MSGVWFKRGVGLAGAALVLAGFAGAAMAGNNHNEAPPVYETYSGPPVIRHIPGIRILFGDYALSEEEYDQLYGQPKKKKKNKKFDESYYEPQPAPAKPKVVKPPAKPAAGAQKPATSAALPQKTATAAASPPAGGPLTCEKATSVVSGYGFSSVEASSCTGKLYAFNAKRDGRSFAIKLDPASGQLTEVKKLP